VLAEDDSIELKNLPNAIQSSKPNPQTANLAAGSTDLETMNRLHVEETYQQCDRNKTKTANALGISRRSLYRLLEKLAID
jgi:transcriptional regulator with PAS, ATPase and Fis domain